LFQKDPDKRLGSGENGLQNLMSHPFFKNIDWNAIYNKKIKPPFTPKFNTESDIVKYIDRVIFFVFLFKNLKIGIFGS
jgi:protein-serine/threonine kinase